MIKEECAKCGRYIKFAKQSPDLIQMVNVWLEKFVMKYQNQNNKEFQDWIRRHFVPSPAERQKSVDHAAP